MPFSYLLLFLKQDVLLANILHVQLYVCLSVVLVIWATRLLTCWCLFNTEDGLLVSGTRILPGSWASHESLGQVVSHWMMGLFSSEGSSSEPNTSALNVTNSSLACFAYCRHKIITKSRKDILVEGGRGPVKLRGSYVLFESCIMCIVFSQVLFRGYLNLHECIVSFLIYLFLFLCWTEGRIYFTTALALSL